MYCRLALVLLAAVASAAGLPFQPSSPINPSTRIRGGENTVIEIHPYQVSVGLLGSHKCGGSILSTRLVLTAGHCAVFLPKYMTVRAGSSFRDQGGSMHRVASFLRHEDFFENEFGLPVNDLALLRLSDPIALDDSRQPVTLRRSPAAPGEMAVVTGWGNTGEGWLADQLQSLALPVISKQDCDSALKEIKGLGKGQMCTRYEGEGKKDACNGDSGGPLTVDGELVGIVSYGDDCRLLEYPGMYTEIAYYYDWILSHLDA